MRTLQLLATLLLCLTIVLCGGVMLRYLVVLSAGPSRVEEMRRLRQAGLAVNQAGEA